MKDIKIFVSHRIDHLAEQIDNPLYIPVRCGAYFDKREDVSMIGDDTGDNISHKRMSYCELTVLYWAWKNHKADYYGLCHYRRFLDFGNNKSVLASTEHDQGCIPVSCLDQETIERHNLTSSFMSEEIEKFDAIFMEPIDLKALNIKSNYDAMKNSPDYHNIKDVEIMMEIIKENNPEMYSTAYEYMFESKNSFLYNCFIMKQNIFNDFCEWLFNILFAVEKRIDMHLYTQQQYRTLGTLGERLVGIYASWLKKQNNYKIGHRPLIFVENTRKKEIIKPAFKENNIPIVSNFNDKYAPVYSAFLSSAIHNASNNHNYDFIIISDDISERHKKILTSQMLDNMSIRFVSAAEYLDGINLVIKHDVYTTDLYYRLIIPQILQAYDKLIVVDADMICREDIANVYNEDIENYLAGGVVDSVLHGYLNGADPSFKPYAIDYMNMNDPYEYINTGFLLFNAKKYRSLYSLQFLEHFIKQHIDNVKIYEQDMLNMLLKSHVKFLDCKWNCYTKSNNFIERCFSLSPLESVEKYNEARNSGGGIIHYAAHPKPWWNASVDMAEEWWKFARMCPCYEELLQIFIGKQSDVSNLRNEFVDIHFPNINRRFTKIESILHHSVRLGLNIRKFIYSIKAIFCFWNRKHYKAQKKEIKNLISNI